MFRKSRYHAPPGFFAAEASGLAWLAVPDGVPVASVHAVGDDFVELTPLVSVAPTPSAAEEFGRRLAVTHDAGADAFGVPPEGYHGPGWIGDAPLNYGHHQRWGAFYAAERIQPYQAIVEKTATVPAETIAGLDRLCERLDAGHWDDTAPPARLHGDLWNGNLLFTADGATLIDPAAHGGHRLTDLAMLALFGLIHSPFPDGRWIVPWGDALPRATVALAAGYALMAACCLAFAWRRSGRSGPLGSEP